MKNCIKFYYFFANISLIFALLSCNSEKRPEGNQKNVGLLKIDGLTDSCYTLNFSATREIEILKNTFSDTVILGYGILTPGWTGSFKYLQNGKELLYNETPDKLLNQTKEICFNLYKGKKVPGNLIIRFLKVSHL